MRQAHFLRMATPLPMETSLTNPARHQVGRTSIILLRLCPLLRFSHKTALAVLMEAPWAPSQSLCLQWLHSCLLAGVSPLRTIVCALLFSGLPSSRKIRHRRRQFRDYSNQLAHRRGACGRSRCLGSRCHGTPAGPLWPRFLSRFGCLTLNALVSFTVFLCLSCPGCWNTALSSPVHPCPSGVQTLLVPSPVLVALRHQHDMFLSVFPSSCCRFPERSFYKRFAVVFFQLEVPMSGSTKFLVGFGHDSFFPVIPMRV